MLFALITAQDTRHAKLAARFPGQAKTPSVIRRIERFFQQHPLNPQDVARFVLHALPDGKRTFILDRTNWKLGKQNVNILVLAVRWRGVAIPLLWETLDHGGSSNQATRAELLAQALELLKPHQIRLLIADREFIGADWLAFLTEHRVPFCLRVRSDTNVDGLPACEWLPDLRPHERGVIAHEVEVMGVIVNVAVTVSAKGDRDVAGRAAAGLLCVTVGGGVPVRFDEVQGLPAGVVAHDTGRTCVAADRVVDAGAGVVCLAGRRAGAAGVGARPKGGGDAGGWLVEVDAGVHASCVGRHASTVGAGGPALLTGWYVKSQNCRVPRSSPFSWTTSQGADQTSA
ncbi:transposase [Deinococcus peraridilitoris]|uniref:transposase n=1 Tax=Deinococcus peraridilitoris TaxID=432329 RepID=UPI003CCBC1E3